MDVLLDYIKQLFELFEQLLEALGIEVDWDSLWSSLGMGTTEEEETIPVEE